MEKEKKVVEATTTEKEGSKFGWGVLGFFFPLVGLILFLVWLKDKKKAAKAAGIGALIGFILNVIVTVLAFTGVISIFTLSGEPVIDVKTNTNTVEKKKDDKTTKKEEVKKEETKKDENKTDSKTEPTSNPCDVKAQARDGSKWNISYSYELSSCETTNIVDDNNNVLFKYVKGNLDANNKVITNNGVELGTPNKEFWKLNDSIVLYSTWCSPGYCYVYVYNTKDNTGFRVDSSIENEIMSPYISGIDSFRDKELVVKFKLNEAAGMESYQNDPRYKVYSGVRTCDIKDIDAALELYKVDDFPIEKSYTFYNVNGSISSSDPRIFTLKSIKQYFNQTCNR